MDELDLTDNIPLGKPSGRDHLAAQIIRTSDDGAFGDRRVFQACALDFDGADAMTGDLDNLVGTAAEPDVAVLVDGAPPYVVAGLRRAGFRGGWLDAGSGCAK